MTTFAPAKMSANSRNINEKSWKNTHRDPEMVHKYDELMNRSKVMTYKTLHEVTSAAPKKITIDLSRTHDISFKTDNRFSMLQSSSNDSLNDVDNEPIQPKPAALSTFERYNRDRINALDLPRSKHQTHHTVGDESKFTEPGDSIYRNYWRYAILKDGSIHCTNASGNRKKLTQLVLRTRTAPFEYINGIPVTNYFAMFRHADRLQYISLRGLNFSNIISLGRCFSDCFELKTVDMSNLDLSNVRDFQHMFDNCRSLKSVDFSGSSMKGAVKTDSMFYGCISIVMITLTGLTGEFITSMNHMFRSCESLRILELPNLQINSNVEMKKLFTGANRGIDIICHSAVILAKYLNDKSSDDSSSSPSMENLNDSVSVSDNEPPQPKQPINEFPHVLTEEQRATAFKWAAPPENIVPSFIDWGN